MAGAYKHHFLVVILMILLLHSSTASLQATKPIHTTQIDTLPYKQTLTLPIDTSSPHAHYQPIDIRITFTPPAWARNETQHSIRVGYQKAGLLTELESQIYDLHNHDKTHIKSCNLVFLIPPEADGTENYQIFHSTTEIPSPSYPNHIQIIDTHYFYEPISGQKIDFDYYKISQDNQVIYGIIQKGELLGEGVSHTVVKLKPNSTEFETLNTDQFGNYAMTYNIDSPLQYTGSARATTVEKTILVNGNLMTRVHIKSTSPENTVTTDGIYTYYYCPTSHKRIDGNINHQVLKTIELQGSKQRDAYLGMSTFKSRSATITNMNVGTILPVIHAYTESDIIADYSLPPDPNSEIQEWLLGTTDDVDLGTQGWVCLDDPTTGKAHGLIMATSTGFTDDDTDGLQIKASVKQVVKLPGLEADTGSLYLTRNSYETGTHSTTIPAGLNITLSCEFYTTETGGHEHVAQEATYYQQLSKIKPIPRGNVTTVPEQEQQRYTLTASVHFEPSFPLGAALSAVIGKRFSYLYAELYKDNSLISSGSLARLPLSEGLALDFTNTTLREKIKLIIGLFDWRNASLFKRIRFPNIQPGTYLIKIYKENIPRQTQRHYIGFSIISVNQDTTTRIQARPQGTIQLSVQDSNNHPIPDAQCNLLYNNNIIAETTTNTQGIAHLNAPSYQRYLYHLQILYQGFQLKKTTLKLRARNQYLTLKESTKTPLYTLNLSIKDSWDLPIAIDVNPRLTSTSMLLPTLITSKKKPQGHYHFTQLIPATYQLKLSYKSFKINTNITIDKNTQETQKFPAQYHITFILYNIKGLPLSNGKFTIQRENKKQTQQIKAPNATAFIPPADYLIEITNQNTIVAKQPLAVRADKTITIITAEPSLVHTLGIILGAILLILSLILIMFKKMRKVSLNLPLIGLLLITLMIPWWSLTGDNGTTTTETHTYLYPPKIVTLTSTTEIKGGEIAAVPEELTSILSFLAILILSTIPLLFIKGLFNSSRRKLNMFLSATTMILLLLIIIIFYLAIAQITDIGVGSVIGEGPLDITLPGALGSDTIICQWSLSIGYYLIILVLGLYLIILFNHKISTLFRKTTLT